MFTHLLPGFISRLSVALIGFAVLVISAKYLGVSSRGEISLFLFNIALLQIITEVFTGYHLVHFMTKYNASKMYRYGVLFLLVSSLIGNTVLLLAGKHIEGFFWQAYLITFLVTLNTFQCVMILGLGKLKMYYGLSLLQPAILLCFLLCYVFFSYDLTFKAYVYPLLFSFVLATGISFFLLWPQLNSNSDLKPFNAMSIIKNGIAAQLALMMFVLGNKYSFYLLKPGAELGLYAAGISIAESVLIMVSAMLPIYLSKIATNQKTADTKALTVKFGISAIVFCSIGIAFLGLLPEAVYLKLLGAGFNGIKMVILFYSPAVLFTALYLILSNYFTGRGQAKIVVRSNLLGFMLTLILAPWLVSHYHLKGAAVCSGVIFVVNTFFLTYFFLKRKPTSEST